MEKGAFLSNSKIDLVFPDKGGALITKDFPKDKHLNNWLSITLSIKGIFEDSTRVGLRKSSSLISEASLNNLKLVGSKVLTWGIFFLLSLIRLKDQQDYLLKLPCKY